MKTYLIVICIFLAIGCRQCAADIGNSLDPLGLYLPRSGVDLSSGYLPRDSTSVDAAIRAAFPLEQPLGFSSELPVNAPPRNSLGRLLDPLRTFLLSALNILKNVVLIPISIVKFLLSPLTLVYNVVKFFVKLFFLPVYVGWKVFKVGMYPFKLVYNKLVAPTPVPPYVVGLPNQLTYNSPVYAP